VVNKRVLFWIGRMGLTCRWRADWVYDEAGQQPIMEGRELLCFGGWAAARDRIAKVGVRDGSVRNDPAVLPEPINKI
jgi:hypothetical protein